MSRKKKSKKKKSDYQESPDYITTYSENKEFIVNTGQEYGWVCSVCGKTRQGRPRKCRVCRELMCWEHEPHEHDVNVELDWKKLKIGGRKTRIEPEKFLMQPSEAHREKLKKYLEILGIIALVFLVAGILFQTLY